jgi:hypothetical protein
MSNYEIREATPLSPLDHREIDYLRSLHSRINSLPKLIIQQHGSMRKFRLDRFIRKKTLKYNSHFPYGSAKRNLAKKIVYSLPLFLRNSIILSLASDNSNYEAPIATSLDLDSNSSLRWCFYHFTLFTSFAEKSRCCSI